MEWLNSKVSRLAVLPKMKQLMKQIVKPDSLINTENVKIENWLANNEIGQQ